jgi:hypothetical protein
VLKINQRFLPASLKLIINWVSHLPLAHPDRSRSYHLAADGVTVAYFEFERLLAHEPDAWQADMLQALKPEHLPR